MTKIEAKSRGYCKHCAGWNLKKGYHSCGITSQETIVCLLPDEVISRWKVEHGLEGTEKRAPATHAFGDESSMKHRKSYWGKVKYKT